MLSDNWAQKARNQGYRSRAVFKLKEILEKTKLTKIEKVLDLGCAPGAVSYTHLTLPTKA